MPTIKAENIENMTDDQLRSHTKKTVWNGEYAIQICKNCGRVLVHPEGDTDKAELVDVCRKCAWDVLQKKDNKLK